MKDSQRLDLYRQHIDTFRQWLGHEFPMVDHVLATLKETVDGGSLNAGTPRDMEFCTINGLREQLRRQASITTTEESAQAAYEWRIRSEGDWHPLYPSDIAMMCLLFGHDVRLAAPASPAASVLTDAARDVLGERQRQVTAEGWSPEHDDEHEDSEMALAAIVYAESAVGYHVECPDTWPWSPNWFKPTTPRRDLVKAGALILAEIERLDRVALLAASMGGDQK